MRIIDMTQGDLIDLIKRTFKDAAVEMSLTIDSRMNPPQPEQPPQQPLYGIEGLATALHVSKPTAQRWKNRGWLEGGYKQIGNTIIIEDAQRLREIADQASKKHKERQSKRKGRRVSYSIFSQA